MFKELTDNLILIGHTKDKMINKNGEDMTEMSLDLVGKLGDIICGEADAVGFMYRKVMKQLLISIVKMKLQKEQEHHICVSKK